MIDIAHTFVSINISLAYYSIAGVPFVGKPLPVVVQGNSFETVTLSGQATEAGTLVVRGCIMQLPGIERHETLLPLLTEDEEESKFMKSIAFLNEGERSKLPSLNDRFDKKRKHISVALSESGEKAETPRKYLELKIVPEQPSLRIRRTSLTNGAVMLYDGETLVILGHCLTEISLTVIHHNSAPPFVSLWKTYLHFQSIS